MQGQSPDNCHPRHQTEKKETEFATPRHVVSQIQKQCHTVGTQLAQLSKNMKNVAVSDMGMTNEVTNKTC